MTKLSVNINKFATLRNSRGGNNPDVVRSAIDAQRFGARAQHVQRLRKTGIGDEKLVRPDGVHPLRDAREHGHRLGGGGRFVEQ